LLHPQIPTPYSSSASPKTIYIKASSPFIPAVKRIRNLLSEITKREKQSQAANSKRRKSLEANGRLKSGDVEVAVAEEAARLKGGAEVDSVEEKEKVYLKATGRAIPRALELGVYFQGEGDCVVRVEMGSVKAIDDIEIRGGNVEGQEEEDVPETRIRTVSSVTVSIGLK
jgi:ribonuclease P/MRP protein subunit POP7